MEKEFKVRKITETNDENILFIIENQFEACGEVAIYITHYLDRHDGELITSRDDVEEMILFARNYLATDNGPIIGDNLYKREELVKEFDEYLNRYMNIFIDELIELFNYPDYDPDPEDLQVSE